MRVTVNACMTVLALSLCACGGGSKSSNPPTGPQPLKDTIQSLEDSGKIPKLDRSNDLLGPDANSNGVRDDIDAWIAALPITDAQKKAAHQEAAQHQATLTIDLKDKAALQASGDRGMASTKCIGDVFMPKYQDGYDLSTKIEAITFNTKERSMRYMDYNQARSGSSTTYPQGNTCLP